MAKQRVLKVGDGRGLSSKSAIIGWSSLPRTACCDFLHPSRELHQRAYLSSVAWPAGR